MLDLPTYPPPYPAQVWARFCDTPRAGQWAMSEDVVSAEVGSAAARFRLRLYCKVSGQIVRECRFQAFGCPYTIAIGSWLADWCSGRNFAEIQAFQASSLIQALEIPEDRAHCWVMAQDVLREISRQIT